MGFVKGRVCTMSSTSGATSCSISVFGYRATGFRPLHLWVKHGTLLADLDKAIGNCLRAANFYNTCLKQKDQSTVQKKTLVAFEVRSWYLSA